jgi:hypothetical protein
MRRIATLATAGLVVLLVVAQFALPAYVSGRVEDRLTERGGSAEVKLGAFPAVRLLFGDGDSARVRARGIRLPLVSPRRRVLADLDGFDDVDLEVTDARLGPFRLATVAMRRDGGDRPYRAAMKGTVTARDLATYGAGQVGGPLGGFLGGMAGGALPFGDEPVPIDIEAVVRSDDGRPRAVVVHGTVAGVPAGALVELLAQAVAGRF